MSESRPTSSPAPESSGPGPSGPGTAPRRVPAWMPLLLVAAAWAAHGGVLQNGWVWDDAIVVRDGREVAEGFSAVPRLLAAPWGGEENAVGLFRPLVSVTLAVQAGIHGTADPFPFHLLNLFVHATVAVLLLAVLRRLLPARPVLASATALLFAVHPAHAGTVSWIVARGDLLAAAFGLAAVLAWTRRPSLDVASTAWTALAFFLALLSKEAAVALLPALVVLDAARDPRGLRGAFARRGWGYAALLVPLAAWAVLRQSAVGGLGATAASAALAGRTWIERGLVGCGALVRAAANLLVPAGLSGDGSADPVLAHGAAIPFAYAAAAAFVVGATVVVAWRFLLRRRSVVDAGWGLFVLLSIPVLQIVPIGAVFEDRFAYLPSLAFLLVPGLLAERLWRVRPRAVPAAVCAAVLLAFCAGSWAVAADWRDEAAFDGALLRDEPKHLRALVRLGRERREQGLALREVAGASPSTPETRPRIEALLRESRVRLEEAVRLLERARALLPQRIDRDTVRGTSLGQAISVLRVLGNTYLALDDPRHEAAEEAFVVLLRILPVHVDGRKTYLEDLDPRLRDRARPRDRALLAEVFRQRSRIAVATGDDEAAARHLGEAAAWAPGERDLERQAGMAWRKIGRHREALPYLERAAELAPASERATAEREWQDARDAVLKVSGDRYLEGVEAFKTAGGMRKARLAFEDVVREQPDFVEARLMLARSARGTGDLRGAIEALEGAKAVLAKRTPGANGEDDAALAKAVDDLLLEVRAEWGKDE